MRIATISITLLSLAAGAPAFAGVLFNDGPIDGTTNAFFISGPSGPFSQTISDGFVATGTGNATSLTFGEWVPTGTTPTSISWSLGTSAFGSDISSGSAAQVGFTFFTSNGFGFDVYTSQVAISGNLVAGNTYFLTLAGSNDSSGSQTEGWDVNGGSASCSFAVSGSPEGDCGAGGEAFVINSSSNAPEPGSIMLLGTGLIGLAGALRRRIKR